MLTLCDKMTQLQGDEEVAREFVQVYYVYTSSLSSRPKYTSTLSSRLHARVANDLVIARECERAYKCLLLPL